MLLPRWPAFTRQLRANLATCIRASFDDVTTYAAFVASAVVVGPVLARASEAGVGQTVLDAVRATREAVGTNTNLGTLLLLAPWQQCHRTRALRQASMPCLNRLSADDTRAVYEAIRLASAGGLVEPRRPTSMTTRRRS